MMPNIPKASRRRSESGFDAMSTTLLPEGAGELAEGELLLLASVSDRGQAGTALGLQTAAA